MKWISSVCLLETARRQKAKEDIHKFFDRKAYLSANATLEAIITTIWEASNQQIKRDAAIGIANKAIVTGLATTPEEFERVVGTATKWAYCAGLDVEYCVDTFVTAAARQSRKLAIDKLSLMIGDRAKLTGLTAAEKTRIFLDDMINATGFGRAKPRGRPGISLDRVIDKRIMATTCKQNAQGLVRAMQIIFSDGSVLNIGIGTRYCDDAWLLLEHVLVAEFSPETKAELDGLG